MSFLRSKAQTNCFKKVIGNEARRSHYYFIIAIKFIVGRGKNHVKNVVGKPFSGNLDA